MPAYAIAVTCVVAASSVLLFLIFYRMKVLNFKTLLSVILASLISALGLPAIFGLVSSGMGGSFDFSSPLVTLLVSVAAYLLIVVILSLIISFAINGAGSKNKAKDSSDSGTEPGEAAAADENYLEQIFVNFIGGQEQSAAENADAPEQTEETVGTVDAPEASAIADETEADTREAPVITNETEADTREIPVIGYETDTFVQENPSTPSEIAGEDENTDMDGILTNFAENAATMGNNLEISVDSNENIDKMGIENIVHNRNSLTIEDCINEAFRLKGAGDFESAILHHMYALDKKPGKELTFWIILDICVMYKSLGQQELALDILNSYYDTYGDTMDISLKEEIRKNLTAV